MTIRRPRRVLVGATGGVAAIKTPALVRRLREAGCEVRVAATADAYRFVAPLALASAAGSQVLDEQLWFQPDGEARHLTWARWADAYAIAPATADALASLAAGRADDVVAALALAFEGPVVLAPAMNPSMWSSAAVQRNVARLRDDGRRFVGPVEGPLGTASEGVGMGRMVEPEEVVEAIHASLAPHDLQGRNVLVSAGPTREHLDPVRFLSNPSSGKMGFALAAAARDRGARVTLVCGPVTLPAPRDVALERVTSAEEMLAALERRVEACDLLLMAAAVADWRPARRSPEKEPKSGDRTELSLVATPDILTRLAPRKGDRVFVGFAMETDRGPERAADKARRKGLDFICLNYPARPETGFGGDLNDVTIVRPDGSTEPLGTAPKQAIAHRILDRAAALLDVERTRRR